MKKLALLALATLLTACPSGGGGGDGSDGGTGGDGGGTSDGGATNCSAGETRCVAYDFHVCQDGVFVDQETCGAPQRCLPDLGCVDCNPAGSGVCSGGDVHACNADGSIGALTEACGIAECQNGQCVSNGCAAGSGLIYVVDDANELLSFDPAGGANTFQLLGTLTCNAAASLPAWGSGAGQPFSMSVDREGQAWVLYTSGEIFAVDTADPSACTRKAWVPGTGGYELFGMGFVADAPGSPDETLFVAGGAADGSGTGTIGAIDPATLQARTVGPFAAGEYGPELTGTGSAELYGYFPGTTSTYVAEIGTGTGVNGQSWALPNLSGDVMAWAFAHWGGRFYIFVTTDDGFGLNTQVLLLDSTQAGQVTPLLQDVPYLIVGAGVSTCAPVELP
ncbi:MAG: hypothetical protein P1V51_16930 [Deltaproteobacteria bacterium]|nr:hypothetical protein [Deltaproteobacteria bacterium]